MQNRKRDTDVQNRLLDSVGEGESGMFLENSIETSILSRVKQITSQGWMHVLLIIGGLNAKLGSQEIPEVTGKFGFGVENEAQQKLTEFYQENTLVIVNNLLKQHKRGLHMDITRWSMLKSD